MIKNFKFKNKRFIVFAAGFLSILIAAGLYGGNLLTKTKVVPYTGQIEEDKGGPPRQVHPLAIESLRNGEYSGSDIVIEQQLAAGSNYQRYITSYRSEGLKIYALLTVPNGGKPQDGWPIVVFNHGYIPPSEYSTTERYLAYTDAFSSSGYILFKPDYRGHGNSEGNPSGYGSNSYTIDVLNAVASIKRYAEANPQKVGMWGHSMGGYITLRNMVTSKDVKAGVIWGGVVASYPDLIGWRPPSSSSAPQSASRRGWRQRLTQDNGSPEQNKEFWDSISANSYLKDISGSLQLHHGTNDIDVPVAFSENLHSQMQAAGKPSEIFTYPGDDHNLSNNLQVALSRSVEFFDRQLK